MSLILSVRNRYPSSSTKPPSPVRSQPSSVMAAAVSSGRLKYPAGDVGRSQPDFAHLPRRHRRASGRVCDAQVDPGVRFAGGPQEVLARPVRVVVARVELRDRACCLGQAVDSEQRAAERPQRRPQDCRRDRRGAVGDRPQRGEVAPCRVRNVAQHLEHRRHEHRVRHQTALEQVQHRDRVEIPDQNRRCPIPQADERPANATDVEHRQGREAY